MTLWVSKSVLNPRSYNPRDVRAVDVNERKRLIELTGIKFLLRTCRRSIHRRDTLLGGEGMH